MAEKLSRNKAYGPYEILEEKVPDGRVLLSLDWEKVRGANIIVAASDNFALIPASTAFRFWWPIAEVTIWGMVQGYANVLKREQIRMETGPMRYTFPDEEAYDKIQMRAFNCSGGRPGGSTVPSTRFSITVQAFIQPRGGFEL